MRPPGAGWWRRAVNPQGDESSGWPTCSSWTPGGSPPRRRTPQVRPDPPSA